MMLFAYNSYRYRFGQRNLFTPDDLSEIAKADAEIEARFALAQVKRATHAARNTVGYYAAESSEARAKRLARMREYTRMHQREISEQRKARMACDPEFAARVRAQNRESDRKRQAKKKALASGDTPAGAQEMEYEYKPDYTTTAPSAQGG